MESSLASYYIPALMKLDSPDFVAGKLFLNSRYLMEIRPFQSYWGQISLGLYLPNVTKLESKTRYVNYKKVVELEDPFMCSLQYLFERHLIVPVPDKTEHLKLLNDSETLPVDWTTPWASDGTTGEKLKTLCKGRKDLLIPLLKCLNRIAWSRKKQMKFHLFANGKRTSSVSIGSNGKVFDYNAKVYVADSVDEWIRKTLELQESEEVTWDHYAKHLFLNDYFLPWYIYKLKHFYKGDTKCEENLSNILENDYDYEKFFNKLKGYCQVRNTKYLSYPSTEIHIYGFDVESQELNVMRVLRNGFIYNDKFNPDWRKAEEHLSAPYVWFIRADTNLLGNSGRPASFRYEP